MLSDFQARRDELILVLVNFMGSHMVEHFFVASLLDEVYRDFRLKSENAKVQRIEECHTHRVGVLGLGKLLFFYFVGLLLGLFLFPL